MIKFVLPLSKRVVIPFKTWVSPNFIKPQEFLKAVETKGGLFESLLVHPKIKAVRRIGLMLAVDLESEQQVYDLVKAGIEKGVIVYFFLSTRNSFRISPPLTITTEEIHEAVKLLNEALDTLKP